MIWVTWWLQWRARRERFVQPAYLIPIEVAGVALIALTGHLGGFLSGVNGGPG